MFEAVEAGLLAVPLPEPAASAGPVLSGGGTDLPSVILPAFQSRAEPAVPLEDVDKLLPSRAAELPPLMEAVAPLEEAEPMPPLVDYQEPPLIELEPWPVEEAVPESPPASARILLWVLISVLALFALIGVGGVVWWFVF